MNRIIRSLLGLNALLVAVTLFSYCSKETPLPVDTAQSAGLADDRTALCTVSFSASEWLNVCGTKTNSNTCTGSSGASLQGTDYAASGSYELVANNVISFFNNTTATAAVTLTCGTNQYNINIPPNDGVSAQVIRNCRLAFLF